MRAPSILIILTSIFVAGSLLRLLWLGDVPAGLTNDEANVGYDAYSILKTGKDQWGVTQPSTSLKGFGDYRPPVYTYVVIPSVALFGLNEFAVRFPSALAGSLTLLAVFILALLLFNNTWIGIVAMTLLAFNPWHVAMSRVGIESTFGVFIEVVACILFLLGTKKKLWIFPAMLLFAVSIYTYTSYILFTPLLVIGCFVSFRKALGKNKKAVAGAMLLFCLSLLPLMVGGKLKTASARSGQVNFTNDIGIINTVNDKRGSCEHDYQRQLCQLFQNKYAAFGKVFITNYLNHFSPELLVVRGNATQFSVLPEYGLVYITEYVLAIIGIFFLVRKKNSAAYLLLSWLLFAPIADSITGSGHYSRFLIILPVIQLIAGLGIVSLIITWQKKAVVLLLLVPFLLYEVITFFLAYWSYFPSYYSAYSHYGYRDLIRFVHDNEQHYHKVIISNRVNDTKQYAFYLFYTQYDPALYQSGIDIEKQEEANGWIRINRIGKVYFQPSITLSEEDLVPPIRKILFAGGPKEFPEFTESVYTVTDLQNHVLFTLASN